MGKKKNRKDKKNKNKKDRKQKDKKQKDKMKKKDRQDKKDKKERKDQTSQIEENKLNPSSGQAMDDLSWSVQSVLESSGQGHEQISQHVPDEVQADDLNGNDPAQDERYQTEMSLEKHVQEQAEERGTADIFRISPEEKIDSEYPAEIHEILEVNDEDTLAEHLAYLQRRLMALKVPVMIILEGAYASGKGRITNELLLGLDARHTQFIETRPPSEEDLKKPFLSRYLETLPDYRKFNIYYRSWYALYNYYKNRITDQTHYPNPEILINEIKAFEKSLADDGYVIIKFKIKIDPEKQKENIQKMKESPLTMWKAQEFDKDNNEVYVREMEKIMKVTDEPYAPWYIVEYTKKSESTVEVMKKVIEILDARLRQEESKPETQPMDRDGDFTGRTEGPLTQVDLSKELSNKEYSELLKPLQKQMREVQHGLYLERIPLVLVFEGWDAAGKGGAIHRMLTELDPTNYTVHTTAAPNDLEKNHHYLWRFANKFPRAGHIWIWDRSWYGRVMVERIEGFATDEEWSRAYNEINNFEKMLTNYGAVILKFFIHIDKETQLERFKARQNNPAKSWKITDEDWRNRDKWDKYMEAVNDLIEKTSKPEAPWHIIEGNNKKYARVRVLQEIIKACDDRLDTINMAKDNDNDKKKKKQ